MTALLIVGLTVLSCIVMMVTEYWMTPRHAKGWIETRHSFTLSKTQQIFFDGILPNGTVCLRKRYANGKEDRYEIPSSHYRRTVFIGNENITIKRIDVKNNRIRIWIRENKE